MKYTKEDVQFHSDGCGRQAHPAVNVKYYGPCHVDAVVRKFGCQEKTAEQALEFVFESSCKQFWEGIEDWARDIFGKGVKVYQEGRSGGWAVVFGLPGVESWDAVLLSKWRKFEAMLKKEVEFLLSEDVAIEDIQSNEWYKDGSESFNFYEFKDGHSESIPDMKAKAKEAGFAPIIR